MNSIYLGYIIAFLGSFFFAIYVVPRKLSNLPLSIYNFLLGIGFFITSTVAYLLHDYFGSKPESLTNPILIYALPIGIFWFIGFLLLFNAIDKIGLSRSNQWKNLQGPIALILSLILLKEFEVTNWHFTIIAGLSIFASALLLNIKDGQKKQIRYKGILYAFLAGLLFGASNIPSKLIVMQGAVYSQLLAISVTFLVTATIYLILKKELWERSSREISIALTGGFLLYIATYLILEAYRYAPVSIAYTIVQLNALWVVAIGIFLFKEIDYRKNKTRLAIAFLFAILGIICLFLAKK